MRGRPPPGPEYVEQLEGSDLARTRLRVVLETIAGSCRVGEACERLGIREDRFAQLRFTALSAGVEALEPRQAGRPVRVVDAGVDERQELLERIAQLEAELQAALVRAELAVSLPQAGAAAAKKSRPLPAQKRTRASK